ncbi:MAG: PilZ domain-containing protein [Phycisphaerales bacterium]
MDSSTETRYEQRLTYRWPMWFGQDTTQAVYPGLMVDVSSGGIAFTCEAAPCELEEGQPLTVRFSLPRFDAGDLGATVGLTRTGRIRWIAAAETGARKIGLQFDTPLSLKPAEQAALAALHCDTHRAGV